jgi:N4-(beta-N-acetylglucosaminyl)-L-asparaginase
MRVRYSRRDFLRTGAALGAATLVGPRAGLKGETGGQAAGAKPAGVFRAVSSGNGARATEKAMELMRQGADPLDAVIAGVNIVEDDPNDMSVGYGGLPNEDGIVELDASVMYGPTHASGAVAAIRNIKNPSRVAKLVMERTKHCLLVGNGALKFALTHGFKRENLLTDKAREAWLKWKETMSATDNWLPPPIKKLPEDLQPVMMTHGTINCIAINDAGILAGVTTTSGLSYKLSGRVGDSPIIGAGLYVDNEIGAAGSTGLGEANIRTCASFQVVEYMGQGMSPEQACLKALERIADKARRWPKSLGLSDDAGRPTFGLNFYALNRKGEFAGATMMGGSTYAVHDGQKNGLRDCAFLFKA